jgi:hypothetical protein
MSKLWIKAAWAKDGASSGPWLVSAYDEITYDEWGKEPDSYVAELAKLGTDAIVRECTIEVTYESIVALFDQPSLPGSVTANAATRTEP